MRNGKTLRGIVAAGVALWLLVVAVQVQAKVDQDLFDYCLAMAQLELAGRYGSPVSLILYNDGTATLDKPDALQDGTYIRFVLRADGIVVQADGSEQRVRMVCRLAGPREPVDFAFVPRP